MKSKTVAADGVTEIVNVPGKGLLVSAVDFNAQHGALIQARMELAKHVAVVADMLASPPGALEITMRSVIGEITIYERRVIPRKEWESMLTPNRYIGEIAEEMEAGMQRLRIEIQGN